MRFGPKRSWKRATTLRSTHTRKMSRSIAKRMSTTMPMKKRMTVANPFANPRLVSRPRNQFATKLIGSFHKFMGRSSETKKRLIGDSCQPFQDQHGFLNPFQQSFAPGVHQTGDQDGNEEDAFQYGENGQLVY